MIHYKAKSIRSQVYLKNKNLKKNLFFFDFGGFCMLCRRSKFYLYGLKTLLRILYAL